MERTGLLTDALMHSADRIDLIALDGTVIESNKDVEPGTSWLTLWHESCRAQAAIALDEARDGRTDKVECYRDLDGRDAWWSARLSPVQNENGEITAVLSIASEVTNEREKLQHHQKRSEVAERDAKTASLVAREMRHRLKNLITIIDSIARMTARQTKGSDFIQVFSRRLSHLAMAQDLLTSEHNREIKLQTVLDTIFGGAGQTEQIKIGQVPDITVYSASLTTIALLVGELMTNSLKYGALKSERGRVLLNCSLVGNNLQFRWQEDCEEPIIPGPEGDGHNLMRRMTAGSAVPFHIDWTGMGMVVQFGINLPKGQAAAT